MHAETKAEVVSEGVVPPFRVPSMPEEVPYEFSERRRAITAYQAAAGVVAAAKTGAAEVYGMIRPEWRTGLIKPEEL